MSRGLRNRNPGNIRRSGVRYVGEKVPSGDPEFREFVAVEWGYRAMFVLLYTYRLRYGLQTVAGLIGRWAPPSENRTESYVRSVADRCGLKDDEPIDLLDPGTMIPLAAAMSEVENGRPARISDVERGWELFFRDFGTERR